MTRPRKQSPIGLRDVVNSAEVLGVDVTSITDDPEGWAVRPEKIAEALRTHSSCIPPAMSGWSATAPMPMTWAGWWLNRMTHGLSRCTCGTDGRTSKKTVR